MELSSGTFNVYDAGSQGLFVVFSAVKDSIAAWRIARALGIPSTSAVPRVNGKLATKVGAVSYTRSEVGHRKIQEEYTIGGSKFTFTKSEVDWTSSWSPRAPARGDLR